VKLTPIHEGLAEDRATGDWYELVDGQWSRIDDERADRLAFWLMLDALPDPLGDCVRLVHVMAVVHLMVRHGAQLIERTNAQLAEALRWFAGEGSLEGELVEERDVDELER
jgi:hypothetical protein